MLCVSVFAVTLPRRRPAIPRRPCEPMTRRSHPCFSAVARIALSGCASLTCSTAAATPAGVRSLLHALQELSGGRGHVGLVLLRRKHDSDLAHGNARPGQRHVNDRDSWRPEPSPDPTPWLRALSESSEPSTAISKCLYMWRDFLCERAEGRSQAVDAPKYGRSRRVIFCG